MSNICSAPAWSFIGACLAACSASVVIARYLLRCSSLIACMSLGGVVGLEAFW